MKLFITIKGPIDSLMLWSLIKEYKPNLTDLDEKVLIYGDFNITSATRIISCCALFGDIKAELSKGS